MERLRFYIANNGGLNVMEEAGGTLRPVASFFEGKTVDHLVGRRDRPEVVFAAIVSDGGYRTRDGGLTWEKLIDGDVRHFCIDPHDEEIVYAGLGPIELLRSEDGGTSWSSLDGMLALPDEVKVKWDVPESSRGKIPPHVRHIFIHPNDSDLLFVLLEHGGVLLSRDRGETWQDRSHGIDYVDMHVIGNAPGSKERYFVSSAQGFFRTEDAGATWHRAENGMPWTGAPKYCYSHEWRIVDGDPPRLVVCGGRGSPGVWKSERTNPRGHILLSDDGGANWRISTNGIAEENPVMPWVLLHHPTETRTLFCGMGDGGRGFTYFPERRGQGAFYRSTDAGESWEPLLSDQPSVLTAWVAPG